MCTPHIDARRRRGKSECTLYIDLARRRQGRDRCSVPGVVRQWNRGEVMINMLNFEAIFEMSPVVNATTGAGRAVQTMTKRLEGVGNAAA